MIHIKKKKSSKEKNLSKPTHQGPAGTKEELKSSCSKPDRMRILLEKGESERESFGEEPGPNRTPKTRRGACGHRAKTCCDHDL